MRKQLLTVTLSAAALFATQAWAQQAGAAGGADQQAAAQQSERLERGAQPGQQQAGMSQQKHSVPMRASQDAIRAIQNALQDKGTYQGEVDGLWGPNTQAAVRQFQQQEGLDASGNLDFSTIAALDVDIDQLGQPSSEMARAGQQDQQSGMDQQQASAQGQQQAQPQDQQQAQQQDQQAQSQDQQQVGSVPDQSITMQLSGGSVREIQRSLQQDGHYEGELDGLWGPQTAQALSKFQQEEGIQGEGLTFDTLAALDLDLQQLAEAERSGQADQQTAGAGQEPAATQGQATTDQPAAVQERESVTERESLGAAPMTGTTQQQASDPFPQQGRNEQSGVLGQQDLRSEGQNPGMQNVPGSLDPVETPPGGSSR